MKKVWWLALLSLGCGSAKPKPVPEPEKPSTINWAAEGNDGIDILRELIRYDTINPPTAGTKSKGVDKANAEETELLKYVKVKLAEVGLESEIIESAPGRGNLIARIKGKGGKKPLLLMAHVDVVSVERKMWTVDPLSAIEKDGFMWGRGALDDKGWAACAIQVMRMLSRSGPSLERDVILMLNADEESSGNFGAKFMIEHHWDKLNCEFVLNEGGRTALQEGKIASVGVQCAEKIYNDFRLWIRGESGHSSIPLKKNAIYEMSRLLAKLESFEAPLQVQATPAAWLEALSGMPGYAAHRETMQAAAKGDLGAAARLAENPEFNAQLRSTFVPTIVKGGIRENILPPDVEVNFNARLLPGSKLDDLIRAIAKHIGVENYEVVDIRPEDIAEWKAKHPNKHVAFFVVDRDLDAPASPLDTALLAAIRKVSADAAPGATVLPQMSSGATDSRFFRARSVTCYGIHPCPTADEERSTVHNHNERVRTSSISWGVKFLYQLTVETGK